MSAPDTPVAKLEDSFLHLGLGGTAIPQPTWDGMDWYEQYSQRHGADGADGRLVSQHTFTEDWESWEAHPLGAEVVICTEGEMVLLQEFEDGSQKSVTLKAGEYAINEPGVWHTADIKHSATAIFITSGEGTLSRPR